MGLFGLGDDRRTPDEVQQAMQHPDDPGALDKAANTLADRLVRVGIDGVGPFDSARAVAEKALRDAGGDRERAIDDIAKDHLKLAALGGFATGLGGIATMAWTMPANLVEFYLLATRATAATAYLRGYDISRDEVRSAVLLALVGADAQDILARTGLTGGLVSTGRLASLAGRQLPKPAMVVLNKAVAFRLISQVGERGLLKIGKAIPFAGGFLGAGLDTYLLNKIVDSARTEFVRRGDVSGQAL